jgi:hypothetical protein
MRWNRRLIIKVLLFCFLISFLSYNFLKIKYSHQYNHLIEYKFDLNHHRQAFIFNLNSNRINNLLNLLTSKEEEFKIIDKKLNPLNIAKIIKKLSSKSNDSTQFDIEIKKYFYVQRNNNNKFQLKIKDEFIELLENKSIKYSFKRLVKSNVNHLNSFCNF